MRRLPIFLLFICCWLFSGQLQAFAAKCHPSSHQNVPGHTAINKSNAHSETIIDLLIVEDNDEDLVKKQASLAKYVAAFFQIVIADQYQLPGRMSAIPGHCSYMGTHKYIAQRVLRI